MHYFILGMVFTLLIQPLLDGLTSLILSFFEMIKSYFAVKIAKSNQKIQEVSVEPKHAIGFRIPDDDDYEEEVETDDI